MIYNQSLFSLQVFLAERIRTKTVCAIKAVEKEVCFPKPAGKKETFTSVQVIIENDDIDITMLERDVLALGGSGGGQQCRL